MQTQNAPNMKRKLIGAEKLPSDSSMAGANQFDRICNHFRRNSTLLTLQSTNTSIEASFSAFVEVVSVSHCSGSSLLKWNGFGSYCLLGAMELTDICSQCIDPATKLYHCRNVSQQPGSSTNMHDANANT
eukprot:5157527-Amphidinium_carterae.1